MTYSEKQRDKLGRKTQLSYLFSVIRDDMDDLKEMIDLTEAFLKKDAKKIGNRVAEEINKAQHEADKEEIAGWYADDFIRLDKVYPIIQRRSLFVTLMCKVEANLVLACDVCRKTFGFKREFNVESGKGRTIEKALLYLCKYLTIRQNQYKDHWEFVMRLWTIRNILVHSDGIPEAKRLNEVTKFIQDIPTLELDKRNRIILKQNSVQIAHHEIRQFFDCLIGEIDRNI